MAVRGAVGGGDKEWEGGNRSQQIKSGKRETGNGEERKQSRHCAVFYMR